jgi:hypothetical protein
MYRPSSSRRGGRLDACLARLLKRPIRLLRLPASGCAFSVATFLRGIATAAIAIPATAAILSMSARDFLAFWLLRRSLLWAPFTAPLPLPPELSLELPPLELPPLELPPLELPSLELPPLELPSLELPPLELPPLELPPLELPPLELPPLELSPLPPVLGTCGLATEHNH